MAREADAAPECCGFSKVASSGQIQIPKEARDALGWEVGTRLMVFIRPSRGELVVTTRPPDEELHDLATRLSPRRS